ncbi:PREDICTED: uncharacterized protein LOC104591679 [Nelumbo nucifera]|uniref:Uncharacterized protein LOC104591679 n=2 Tax=Nelumbo nucifera TaxID=4432 RepID=A0A1U7ZKQ3_NELNU|nr:PREDICTED: uncharacterized protein LOC104591679 [Nelumbo nucifera]XP_010248943.1 PREDICTED: uncharacterized protein LOC104591679 [Nelumbo nucifera]DAD30612.1 TPA_asm: hypothetical protein HUJ06_009463 [Nelumbo nucifera]
MESGTSSLSRVSPPASTGKERCRFLHTFAVSMLSIAHRAYIKAEEFGGPIGSLTHKLAGLTAPIAYILQCQWLVILGFLDDHILAVENRVETLFPPSAYLFDQIDALAQSTVCLPEKFDAVADQLPAMLHRLPFLDCALSQMKWGFNFVMSTLTDWGNDKVKEKEIRVDINCMDRASEAAPSYDKTQTTTIDASSNAKDENEVIHVKHKEQTSSTEEFPSIVKTQQTKSKSSSAIDKMVVHGGENGKKQVKSTYKDILEMGKQGNEEQKKE